MNHAAITTDTPVLRFDALNWAASDFMPRDQEQSHRHCDHQSLACLLQILKLASPGQQVACGEINFATYNVLRFGHESTQVPAADIALNKQTSADCITTDFRGAFLHANIGKLR